MAKKNQRYRIHQRAGHCNIDHSQPSTYHADEWVLQCRIGTRLWSSTRQCWTTHTLKEWNKRGDWIKQWLTIQNFTALNTMCRRKHEKQATYRSPTGTEKQFDYILCKRRHLSYSKDAEANDMIHMGSDHRSVMATFVMKKHEKECPPRCTQYQAKKDYNEKYQCTDR